MRQLLNQLSFQNSIILFLFSSPLTAQLINYVSNPGFELLTKPYSNYTGCKDWTPITPNKFSYHVFTTSSAYSIATAPYVSTGFQYPRTGQNFILGQFYCPPSTCTYTWSRGYPKNKLKFTLKPNTKYSAKYYVVNTNNCVVGINHYGIYLTDSSVDTINYCVMPLTYLTPQIEYKGLVIKDTLNWIPITGTFVANGSEKYLILGNFKSDADTDTLIINPTYLPSLPNDIYIDDVSLIECDQPAYAGPDKACMPGDSVFIGSPPDVGIDEISVWYKLPSSIPIATVAGLWVKPVVTTTYVVRQDLCGTIKWDTVVVYQDAVGLVNLKILEDNLQIFPVPVNEELNLRVSDPLIYKAYDRLEICNSLGQVMKDEELRLIDGSAQVNVSGLPRGMYFLQTGNGPTAIRKKFLISR
jgi:hypothetical protein